MPPDWAGEVAMSIFHKLQDVYFDAVKLHDAIAEIPAQCDCADADAHLSGKCCCAVTVLTKPKEIDESCSGCLGWFAKVTKDLEDFEEDFVTEQRQIITDDDAGQEIKTSLFVIQNLMASLRKAVTIMKEHITIFRASCAHKDLQALKERNVELEKCIAGLNAAL